MYFLLQRCPGSMYEDIVYTSKTFSMPEQLYKQSALSHVVNIQVFHFIICYVTYPNHLQ
jgi:hypothetical protein